MTDEQWREFLGWAEVVRAHLDLDAEENDYKRELARKLAHVREQFLSDTEGWAKSLVKSIRGTNLLHWRTLQKLQAGATEHPDSFAEAVGTLWSSEQPQMQDLRAFEAPLRRAVSDLAPGNIPGFGSLLLMARDPENWPPYRAEPVVASGSVQS